MLGWESGKVLDCLLFVYWMKSLETPLLDEGIALSDKETPFLILSALTRSFIVLFPRTDDYADKVFSSNFSLVGSPMQMYSDENDQISDMSTIIKMAIIFVICIPQTREEGATTTTVVVVVTGLLDQIG